MKEQLRTFPFRWVLPAIQLLICFLSLWPSRNFILFEVSQSIESYAPTQSKKTIGRAINIEMPTLTPVQQDAADRATKIEDLRMRVPLALNFPVLITQLPYVIASPAKREWAPNGMMTEAWREISWPFAGLLFWWSIARGIEALRSTRKAVVSPRVTLAETVFAAVFVCVGVAVLVGTVMSTPDDRRDVHFIALMADGLLWGILASIMIAARIFQWRIRRRAKAAESLA
jgi:hypothetical protein